MGRPQSCSGLKLRKGAWTSEEDLLLKKCIEVHGEGSWPLLPQKTGLQRSGKSCRLRWLNYLSPNVKRGNISEDEELLIIRMHRLLGNRWALIAGRIPGRSDNEIKNYWNTHLSKKVNRSRSDDFNCNKENVVQTLTSEEGKGGQEIGAENYSSHSQPNSRISINTDHNQHADMLEEPSTGLTKCQSYRNTPTEQTDLIHFDYKFSCQNSADDLFQAGNCSASDCSETEILQQLLHPCSDMEEYWREVHGDAQLFAFDSVWNMV